jgi:hypothetical protein
MAKRIAANGFPNLKISGVAAKADNSAGLLRNPCGIVLQQLIFMVGIELRLLQSGSHHVSHASIRRELCLLKQCPEWESSSSAGHGLAAIP